jgi:hypothetical protein
MTAGETTTPNSLDPPDPHANFRAEVECYVAADPTAAIENLSRLTGIPVDRIVRYVLVKYAASSSDALLSLRPIVFRQMQDQIEKAEAAGTDDARLGAYRALREIISWLNAASG